MYEIMSADEAIRLIRDGDCICVNSFVGIESPVELHEALYRRYRKMQSPSHLTIISSAGFGVWDENRNAESYIREGAVDRLICGHFGAMLSTKKIVLEDRFEAYNLPLGCISHAIRAQAGGLPGALSKVGLDIFVDPRQEGPGINRPSIGVQSFRDDELKLLGRIHTAEEAKDVMRAARRAGFSNLSLDLISALPGQKLEDFIFNLEEAAALRPEHISVYSLILEKGTPLARMAQEGQLPPLPGDELDREMYRETAKILARHGYHRYEISNYAMDGFESRHNSGYWTGREYLGLGLGASSYFGGVRFRGTASMGEYLGYYGEKDLSSVKAEEAGFSSILQEGSVFADAPREEMEQLSEEDRMAEFMFLGLRMMRGVSESEFFDRFGVSMEDVYGKVLQRHLAAGVIERTDGRVFLTERGIDVSNAVMADYLL